jgi:hypothetical protein
MNTTPAVTTPPTLKFSREAVLVLGIGGSFLPFCESPHGEVERWLRLLRLQGRAGRVLRALGVSDDSLSPDGTVTARRAYGRSGQHVIDLVSAAAIASCLARDGAAVETSDILSGLIETYGTLFEETLEAHGTSAREVQELLPFAGAE